MKAVSGGWPGAWIAQQALRHKIVKLSLLFAELLIQARASKR